MALFIVIMSKQRIAYSAKLTKLFGVVFSFMFAAKAISLMNALLCDIFTILDCYCGVVVFSVTSYDDSLLT